jgi:cytochrome d ubiquinol oxidase subunit II
MELDLPLIWAGLIATAVFLYVFLDGFDLGVGILFPFAREHRHRDTMMSSLAPFWDGNETWLVLGGGGLFAAFPLAYAIIMPALYLPLIVMLLALVFRGVAFEFRFKAVRSRPIWDWAFSLGSTLAAFAQGIVLGTFVQGIPVESRAFAGGPFDWLSPFALLTGVALVVGYALLGATWLARKTETDLQEWAFQLLPGLMVAVVVAVGAVSLWTPLLDSEIARRWFSFPNIIYLSPVPLLVLALAALFLRAVARRQEETPFFCALGMFLLSYIGLAISLYPYIVPRHVTFREAAAPDVSLEFMLWGAAILLPLILAYTAYNYWVFRGKTDEAGYHH